MVFEGLLIHTFAVFRRVRASDGQGGWTEARVEVGSTKGRLRPIGASERTVADQQQAQVSHVLYTLAGVDVRRGDELEGAGVTVELIAVREPSMADHHYQIDCRQIQLEATEEVES